MGSKPNEYPACCVLKQRTTLKSLISTGWFQKRLDHDFTLEINKSRALLNIDLNVKRAFRICNLLLYTGVDCRKVTENHFIIKMEYLFIHWLNNIYMCNNSLEIRGCQGWSKRTQRFHSS